jgi:hypothetical protein
VSVKTFHLSTVLDCSLKDSLSPAAGSCSPPSLKIDNSAVSGYRAVNAGCEIRWSIQLGVFDREFISSNPAPIVPQRTMAPDFSAAAGGSSRRVNLTYDKS